MKSALSKSYVQELVYLFESLFRDIKQAFPCLGRELDLDLARLRLQLENRGVSVALTDLPALGKHLDRCLAEGTYRSPGLFLTRERPGPVKVPRFLGALYLRVFSSDGCLLGDPDVEAIFFIRQVYYLAKKAKVPCGERATAKAIASFVETDDSLPNPRSFWLSEDSASACHPSFTRNSAFDSTIASDAGDASGDSTDPIRARSSILAALDRVSILLIRAIGSFDPMQERAKHGPGVCSNINRFGMKYKFHSWPADLERSFPLADYGFHSYSAWAAGHEAVDDVKHTSRLIAVPKTYAKPRLIAAEPCERQWCQQLLMSFLFRRAEGSWINEFVRFTDQTFNQELCIRASRDSSLATVDMTDASDRVSCAVVESLFRGNPKLLIAIRDARTQWIEIPGPHAFCKRLRKFSTMGNACTFPVEAFAFLTVCLASVLVSRRLAVTERNIRDLAGSVAVFGDDIIVPVDSMETFRQTCALLGFRINEAKTYETGKFRESCGVESFAGHDVTPARWNGPPERTAESYARHIDACNNFYKKFLLHTSMYLESTIMGGKPPMTHVNSGVLGLRCRGNVLLLHRIRYNKHLQRHEYLIPALSSEAEVTEVGDDCALLQFFTEQPSRYTKWCSGQRHKPTVVIRKAWVAARDILS